MIRSEKGMSVPESRQGQRPRPTGTAEIGAEVKPVSNADYSELPPPTMNGATNTGKTPVKSALKSSNLPGQPSEGTSTRAPVSQADNSSKPGGSLLDGAFDEGESHGSFLEALKAFRGEPTTTTAGADEKNKSVRFQGDAADKATAGGAKKNFFANLDNNDFNVNCLPEPPTFQEGGTKPDQSIADPKYGPKDSCW